MSSPRATSPQSESEFLLISGDPSPIPNDQPASVEYEAFKKLQQENAELKKLALQLENELAELKRSPLADEYQKWENQQVDLQRKLDDTKKEFFVATMQKRFRHKKLVKMAEPFVAEYTILKNEIKTIKTERASLYIEFETKLKKIMQESKGTDIATMSQLLQQRKDELLRLEQEKTGFVQAYRKHEEALKTTLLTKIQRRTQSKLKVNDLRKEIKSLEDEKLKLAQAYVDIERNWQTQNQNKNNQWISAQMDLQNDKRKLAAENASNLVNNQSIFCKVNRSTLTNIQKQQIDGRLFRAILDDNLKNVIACFQQGADVEAYNEFGMTPLMSAIAKNNPSDGALAIASYLFTVQQANPNAKSIRPIGARVKLSSYVGNKLNWNLHEGTPAIVFGILCWDLNEKTQKIFDLFMQRNVNLEVTDYYDYSPLRWAVESHNESLITYLIQNGARVAGVIDSFFHSSRYDKKIMELLKSQALNPNRYERKTM